MIPPCPPPSPHEIDWGTLWAGFGLGLIGSFAGSVSLAWATSLMGRRDHQFQRMLHSLDEVRHDIERAIAVAADYWPKAGSHADCARLEAEMFALQNKIIGTLAIVRKLDPKRLNVIETQCEEDFMDALTGGQFQVRTRPADPSAVERLRRFAGRLSEKVGTCSTTPSARLPLSRR